MNPYFTPQNPNIKPIELEAIRIASPCRADWGKMRGDDQIRHCTSCAKNVYNLSAMTREAASRLILEKEGNLCVQLHRREDGTVISSDCAVGISDNKKSMRAVPRFLAGVFAALLGIFGGQTIHAAPSRGANSTATVTRGEPAAVMMGEMPVMGTPAPPTMGRMLASPLITKKKTTLKKSGGNHGKRTSGTTKRSKKSKLNRRHR